MNREIHLLFQGNWRTGKWWHFSDWKSLCSLRVFLSSKGIFQFKAAIFRFLKIKSVMFRSMAKLEWLIYHLYLSCSVCSWSWCLKWHIYIFCLSDNCPSYWAETQSQSNSCSGLWNSQFLPKSRYVTSTDDFVLNGVFVITPQNLQHRRNAMGSGQIPQLRESLTCVDTSLFS